MASAGERGSAELMATKTTTITEYACDRCGDRIVKQRPFVLLQTHGVDTLEDIRGAENVHCALELCKGCEDSLRLWWTGPERRAKKSEAAE